MSFSNNSSRTTLKEDAYGTRLTLSETLRVPTIYLNGSNLSTQLTNIKTSTPSTLSTTCTGFNLDVTNKLKCKALDIVNTASDHTYMDMRNTNGNSDFDARIGVKGGNSTLVGQGTLELVAASCEINAPFTASHLNAKVITIGENDTNGFSYIDMLTKDTNTPFSVRFECVVDDFDSGLGTLTVTSNKNTFSGKTMVQNLLSCHRIEVGTDTPDAFSYIDMKTHGKNNDYDVRLGCEGGSSESAGLGTLTVTSDSNVFSGDVSANSFQINGTSSNTYLGHHSGLVTTTGHKNSCFGHGAGELITTGFSNTCVGHTAGGNITTGQYNTCVGSQAGVVTSNGVSATPTTGIYIGALTKPTQYASNETVIGFDVAGSGRDTVTIGNDYVVATFLKGESVYCGDIVGSSMELSGGISCEGEVTMNTATITTANITTLSVTGTSNIDINEIKAPIINQSTYITFHGTSYGTGTYTVTNYKGLTQNSFYTLDDIRYDIPENCISLQIVYSYYTDITNNYYQGLKKFYYLKGYTGTWNQHITDEVGSFNNFMPVITVTSEGKLIINPPEITIPGSVIWCFSIWFY
jgi:hypothetical protein